MKIFVKPKIADSIVRDPITLIPIPAGGKSVTKNSYWLRRIMFGDVVQITDVEETVKKSPKSSSKKDK